MAKRDWSKLSPAYRNRLGRSGIDRAAYESGTSLSAARGHSRTPEHPTDLIKPGKAVAPKYQAYAKKHTDLQKQVQEKKQRVFGNRIRFNREHSDAYVIKGVPNFEIQGKNSPIPGVAELKRVLAISDEDLDAEIIEIEDKATIAFLYYH